MEMTGEGDETFSFYGDSLRSRIWCGRKVAERGILSMEMGRGLSEVHPGVEIEVWET